MLRGYLACVSLTENKKKAWTRSLPEVFSTIDAGQHLAAPAHVNMFIHLGFFQRFATTVAGKEHHFWRHVRCNDNFDSSGSRNVPKGPYGNPTEIGLILMLRYNVCQTKLANLPQS